MALHAAMIGGVQFPGFRDVVYSAKRGLVSTIADGQIPSFARIAVTAPRTNSAGSKPSDS